MTFCKFCKAQNHNSDQHICKLCREIGKHSAYHCPTNNEFKSIMTSHLTKGSASKITPNLKCRFCKSDHHVSKFHICKLCRAKGQHSSDQCTMYRYHYQQRFELTSPQLCYQVLKYTYHKENKPIKYYTDGYKVFDSRLKLMDVQDLYLTHSADKNWRLFSNETGTWKNKTQGFRAVVEKLDQRHDTCKFVLTYFQTCGLDLPIIHKIISYLDIVPVRLKIYIGGN